MLLHKNTRGVSVPEETSKFVAHYVDQLNSVLVCLQVVEHYEKPRNVGSFDKKDLDVGTGLVGAPACGDVMKLQIRVRTSSLFELILLKSALLFVILSGSGHVAS